MSNPLDDYFELRKESSWMGDVWRGVKGNFSKGEEFGKMLGSAGVGVAASAGIMAAVPAAKKLYGAITKRRDFNAMLEHNPDLQEHQAANTKQFNQAYSSLRKINEDFAADPLIAGGLMRRMMASPEAAAPILMNAHKDNRGQFADPHAQALTSGAMKTMGKDFGFGSGKKP